MRSFLILISLLLGTVAQAQINGMPRLPASAGSVGKGGVGLQGSVGVGFADFNVQSPHDDFKIDRGMFAVGQIERGFNVLHLYLTLGLSYMTAEGTANYRYKPLGSTNNFSQDGVKFKAAVTDLSLGLKLKLIDEYWFRPYVEGGGLAGYHQITYTSDQQAIAAQGDDYKMKDVSMGSGYYGEAGLEAMFSDRFGVKLAARQSWYQTKKLETLADRTLLYSSQTYYFALLFGF